MRIALVSSFVPFVNGGYRHIVEWLEAALRTAGHQVERVYLPHVESPERLHTQMAAYRWVRLDNADRVICFRPPAHFVKHPHKIVWFIHHLRTYYDLWDTPYRGMPVNTRTLALRNSLHEADTRALAEARKVFCNSKVVAERLQKFNSTASQVLYPPVFRPERFRCSDPGEAIVMVCRVEHHKRQHLLVEALRHTKSPVRLVLLGAGSDAAYIDSLQQMIGDHDLADRVTFTNQWVSEEEKIEHLASALAAAYLPVDEDSYGYPTLEAAHSCKAVLTTSDSGGVLEFVQDGINGFVCEPTPKALAAAMDRLYRDRHLATELGRAAQARVGELRIDWDTVLHELLA